MAAILFGGRLAAETVRLTDAAPIEGAVVGMSAETLSVRVGGKLRELPVASVSAVEFTPATPASLMATPGRCVAIAEDGSRIGCTDTGIADGKLTAHADFAAAVVVPVRALAWLLLPAAHERPLDIEALTRPLRLERGDQDAVIVQAPDGDAVAVPGILLRLNAREVVLDYDGIESPMPTRTVKAIQLAKSTTVAPVAPATATVFLRDGSSIAVRAIATAGDQWVLTSGVLGTVHATRESLGTIRFRNAQAVALTTITPDVEQTAFFDESFLWQRNRAVGGGALQLAGRVYETGIGMHARCRLVFPLDGAYRKFAALAGIDDSATQGAARLLIQVDDAAPTVDLILTAAAAPQVVDLDVSGARRLTILADFVPGAMGSGARVSLCDTVLSK